MTQKIKPANRQQQQQQQQINPALPRAENKLNEEDKRRGTERGKGRLGGEGETAGQKQISYRETERQTLGELDTKGNRTD